MIEIEKLKIKREEALKRQKIKQVQNKIEDVRKEKRQNIEEQEFEKAAYNRDKERILQRELDELNEESK